MSGTLAREWFGTAELADLKLAGLPGTVGKILGLAARRDWLRPEWQGRYWRPREGRGGGVELHYSVLPHEAQLALALRFPPAAAVPDLPAPGEADIAELERAEAWARYERAPAICRAVAAGAACKGAGCRQRCQRVAQERLAALQAVEAIEGGMGRLVAILRVARERGIARSTIHNWFSAVATVDRVDRLPALLPHQAGTVATRTDMPQEAWDELASDWLRGSRASFEACWRRLQVRAAETGWKLVSKRTALRRMMALPVAVRTAGRGTKDNLKRLYPAQERDRSGLYAMEAVNNDAHQWDVTVLWPDGSKSRPQMETFADLYSGKILSWRLGKTVSSELVRLAFGDMVERFGVPRRAVMDNGREQAAKLITGGIQNRYRFQHHADDPVGILTAMGVEVLWTTPYSGQSKPIERAFRDMAHDIAKHPAFDGAYVGHNVLSKPDNHGSRAVPLAEFQRVIAAEIVRWNARPGRRSKVCDGRSFDEAFEASYQQHSGLIPRPTEAQRRLWLLAAETATVSRRDGATRVLGNRFWSEKLHALRGQKVVVRYDPAQVQADLHVYRLDGSYVVAATCIDPVGFFDREAAGEFNRARRQKQKAVKAQLAALKTMTAAQLATRHAPPAEEPPDTPLPAPETQVIRPVFGNTALKPVAARQAEPTIDFDANFGRNLARMRNRLRPVGDEDV